MPALAPTMTDPHPHANPTLVEAWRGGIVESAHRGAFAVVDADGRVHSALGDIDRPVFPRSAIKVLQALPLVASGAAERLGLVDEELALACASHGGEAHHTRAAASMLAKAGLDESALECGAHWPYDEASARELARQGRAPGALHNNCSGKHAGFACLACALHDGQDLRGFLRGYVEPEHPVQREVAAAVEAATGWPLAGSARGVDGCSIPTYAIPLRPLALAFARVATGQGLQPGHARAARRLRQAVAAAPQQVAGSHRMDRRLMARFGERVFCKVGAEGMYCIALPQAGLGIAIKMDDGNTARACEVVAAALIESLAGAGDEDSAFLAQWSSATLRNWNGREIGRLAAAPALRQALGHGGR